MGPSGAWVGGTSFTGSVLRLFSFFRRSMFSTFWCSAFWLRQFCSSALKFHGPIQKNFSSLLFLEQEGSQRQHKNVYLNIIIIMCQKYRMPLDHMMIKKMLIILKFCFTSSAQSESILSLVCFVGMTQHLFSV
jgi:hypothetical protein